MALGLVSSYLGGGWRSGQLERVVEDDGHLVVSRVGEGARLDGTDGDERGHCVDDLVHAAESCTGTQGSLINGRRQIWDL